MGIKRIRNDRMRFLFGIAPQSNGVDSLTSVVESGELRWALAD